MGTQQTKSDDELETNVHSDQQQQYDGLVREPTDGLERMNEICKETVMTEQNHILLSSPKRLTVDNIKIEPQAVEDYSEEVSALEQDKSELVTNESTKDLEQNKSHQILENLQNPLISTESINISLDQAQEESLPAILDISTIANEDTSLILDPLRCSDLRGNILNIEIKKELLETNEVTSDIGNSKEPLELTQSSLIPELTDGQINEISNRFQTLVKRETIDNIVNDETLDEENIHVSFKTENDGTDKEENNNQQQLDIPKLVKNPFFKGCNKSKRVKQELIEENFKEYSPNKTIKAELIHNNEELNTLITTKPSFSSENPSKAITIIHEEYLQTSINLKELNIKTETLYSQDDNLDWNTNNNNLYINCLSDNLNSSLDVNLSNVDTDFEEALSSHSREEIKSTVSLNSSLDSLNYFTIIDLSCGEKSDIPINDSPAVTSSPQKLDNPKADNKTRKCRPRKPRQKRNLENSKPGQIQKPRKRGRKPGTNSLKSKKFTKKDYAYSTAKKVILKNLPKISIKTREKVNKQNSNQKTSDAKNDFPKPFKLEPTQSLNKELSSIATELPKPMMFKCEKDINSINSNTYLKPEFQPYVRLKRLKSEDLLVPLKTKHTRKRHKPLSYQRMMSTDNRRDLLIQHAFSLNQRAKLNRLSLDHDPAYYNNHQDQPSLYSRLTTPLSMPMDTTNESVAETDSRYFSPQELYSLFNSTTPDASSMFSGHIDSGVSTSTPSMQQQRQMDYSKTLLLEIAAERAFINNHLMHFGYSPIQFDLFNNVNDLNIFLKYLMGSANMN